MKLNETTLEILNLAAKQADAKQATEIVALNVAERFGYADAFLIMSGEVERNVQAIADTIEDELNSKGVKTLRREGRELGRWVLLDFGDIVAHIFHAEDREFYDLERLWKDSEEIALNY